jgi:hypothetical protein
VRCWTGASKVEPQPDPQLEPVLSELGPSAPLAIGPTLSPEEPRPPAAAENGLSDSQRRSAAKSIVLRAVVEAARNANAEQIRYEMALQAKNGQVKSMSLFEEEAKIRGPTVQVLADQIVAQRLALERRMSQVYTIQARALADIERATGEAIDTIAASAVTEIAQGARPDIRADVSSLSGGASDC